MPLKCQPRNVLPLPSLELVEGSPIEDSTLGYHDALEVDQLILRATVCLTGEFQIRLRIIFKVLLLTGEFIHSKFFEKFLTCNL